MSAAEETSPRGIHALLFGLMKAGSYSQRELARRAALTPREVSAALAALSAGDAIAPDVLSGLARGAGVSVRWLTTGEGGAAETAPAAAPASFGARVRYMRETLGITQGALAESMGVVQSTVSKIENAMTPKGAAPVPVLVKVAEALGAEYSDLVAGFPCKHCGNVNGATCADSAPPSPRSRVLAAAEVVRKYLGDSVERDLLAAYLKRGAL